MIRPIVLLLTVCTVGQQTCSNNSPCKRYSLTMKDGSVRELTAFYAEWDYPDCFIAKDENGQPSDRICNVASFEFTTKPLPEQPK